MPYNEQIFTNLGAVQAPDDTQANAFSVGNQPFEISDQTNQVLSKITENQIAKREKEVQDWNKKMETALTTVNKLTDDVAPRDMAEINKKQKELFKYIYDNPQVLAGHDIGKQKELDKMMFDISSQAQLSKGLKKIEDNYKEDLQKNPNKVNEYLFAEYQKGTPEERASKIFTPIRNPENEFVSKVVPSFYKNPSGREIKEEASALDPSTMVFQNYGVYDENKFKNLYNAYVGDYKRKEWEVSQELHDEFPTADDYVNSQAGLLFEQKKALGNPQIRANQSDIMKNRADMQEDRQTFTAEENAKKALAKQNAMLTKEQVSTMYPDYSAKQKQFDELNKYTPNKKEATELAKKAGLEGELYNISENRNEAPDYTDANNDELAKLTAKANPELFLYIDNNGNKYYYAGKMVDKALDHLRKIAGINTQKTPVLNLESKKSETQMFDAILGSDTSKPRTQFNLYQKRLANDLEQGKVSAEENVQGNSSAKSGSIALTHNNPANIKFGNFAKKYGATEGKDSTDGGRFAKFNSMEEGLKARRALLKGNAYSNLTVDEAMKKWSNKGYGGNIYPEIANKRISELTNDEFLELEKRQIKNEDVNVFNIIYGGSSTPKSKTATAKQQPNQTKKWTGKFDSEGNMIYK